MKHGRMKNSRMNEFLKTRFHQRSKIGEACCPEFKIRRQFRRYHQFFLFSPFLMLILMFVAFMMVKSDHIPGEGILFTLILGLVVIKEIVSITVSVRLDKRILAPIEVLKNGFSQVSKGNYDVRLKARAVPEVAELIEAFNDMSNGLLESEKLKLKYENNRRELLANISHDLKTPITSINGFIDGIVDGVADTSEKQEAYYRIIQQNARYMNRLIDDLMLYSKLDMHVMTFEMCLMPMGLYVRELFQELQLEGEERGVVMNYTETLGDEVSVLIDCRHMTRAIRNVVTNAIVHNGAEKIEINVDLKRAEDHVILCIHDNGFGIDQDQLDKIFDRFYKVDNSRGSSTGGSGLGLAIAKEIVEANGGQITVQSQVNQGTTICMRLPIKVS